MIAISFSDSFKTLNHLIKSFIENNLNVVINGTETRDSLNRGGEYFWIKTDNMDVYLMYYNEETMEIDNDEYQYLISAEGKGDDDLESALFDLLKESYNVSIVH